MYVHKYRKAVTHSFWNTWIQNTETFPIIAEKKPTLPERLPTLNRKITNTFRTLSNLARIKTNHFLSKFAFPNKIQQSLLVFFREQNAEDVCYGWFGEICWLFFGNLIYQSTFFLNTQKASIDDIANYP